ncbi:MAG: hypothetical protein CL454_00830 [Acidimicrobiaceae bacterium]|nr:hypothetical protein [Acidimicrobiaceae bacterium]
MWNFSRYRLVATEEPQTIPPGTTRVLNLRGSKTPAYPIPEGVLYKALFLQGGPSARVPFWKISKAVDFVRQTEPGSACLVHCQHGLNRTGLVACAVAAQEIGLTAEEAMEAFSQIRPPGIQRQQVRRTLRKWLKWVRSGSPPAKKTRQPKKKNGRIHRPPVLNHRSEENPRQHSVHVERSGRERIFIPHQSIGRRHGGHVRNQVHARPSTKETREAQPQQEEVI